MNTIFSTNSSATKSSDPASAFSATGFVAAQAACHQLIGSCSLQPGCGESVGTAAEASAISVPSAWMALTFSEPVTPLAFRWFPPHGAAVDAAPAAAGARVAVPLPAGAGVGTYLLSWRVAAADGHPAGGSLAFSVGAPTPAAGPPATERPAWAAAAGRGFLTLALVFGVGGAVFLRLVDRDAAPLPRARRLALLSALAVAPAAVVASGLHGLDLLGAPAAALLGPAPWAVALASPFARSAGAAILAAAAAVAALRGRGGAGPLALVAWGLAATSFALFGHAATASPRWLAAPAVALHAAAVIFWIGALPALAERAATDRHGLAPSLRRFSAVAVPLVGLLVLSGGLLAVAQFRDPAALPGTAYGRLLLAKLALVAPLIGLAVLNRLRLTPAIARGAAGAPARFRHSVRAEIVLAVAILALASGFRLTPPPRALAAPAAAELRVHLHDPTLMAGLALAPGRPGPNTIAVTFPPAAPPPLELGIAFAAPAAGVEPIRLAARRDGATWSAGPLVLPRGGEWQVTLDVLVDDFEQVSLRTVVQVPDR